jgi:hypothetical protein
MIYKFSEIPTKIPVHSSTKIEKAILKFIWKHKRTQIVKAILSKKSSAGGITIPDYSSITIYCDRLLRHSNKSSLILSQNQTYRPMKQNIQK